MLRPEDNVDIQPEPVDGDFHPLGNRVHPAHSVEDDVDRGYENLPHAIGGEEVSQEIEVFALPGLGPLVALSHVLQVVGLHEQVSTQLLKGLDVLAQLRNVFVCAATTKCSVAAAMIYCTTN